MDVTARRQEFPVLDRAVNGQPLAYLDNAATAQKPQPVIDAVTEFYEQHNANVHRCVHTLGEEATAIYDDAHRDAARFVGGTFRETVFTRNTTAAINLLAHGHTPLVDADQNVVVTEMDHHSNLVPWQRLAQRTGAELRYIPVTDECRLDMAGAKDVIDDDTAVVAMPHASNVLGTVTPVAALADIAADHGATSVVDAAQSVPHMPVDVAELGCDALAFSGHKMCGPTGTGVLWAREALLERMEPYETGGGMISRVTHDDAAWNELPWKFEAGTPHVAGAAGLSAAIEYLTDIGMENVAAHSRELGEAAYERLSAVDGVTVYGPADRIGLVSFTVDAAERARDRGPGRSPLHAAAGRRARYRRDDARLVLPVQHRGRA